MYVWKQTEIWIKKNNFIEWISRFPRIYVRCFNLAMSCEFFLNENWDFIEEKTHKILKWITSFDTHCRAFYKMVLQKSILLCKRNSPICSRKCMGTRTTYNWCKIWWENSFFVKMNLSFLSCTKKMEWWYKFKRNHCSPGNTVSAFGISVPHSMNQIPHFGRCFDREISPPCTETV